MNMAVSNFKKSGRPIKLKSTYGPWWDSELIVLESMLEEHKTFTEIADVLDCTPHRVRQKVEILKSKGLPPTKGGRPRHQFRRTRGSWWDCEVTVLKAMLQDKFKVPYISEVLDRDTNCVHTKIKYLQMKGEL
ncbi:MULTISPECIES: hypothetical protein [unclassified Acinetobacter]|uniref:hypothetical protein n=1 Tax=unclassified Acinetobacter TaxID=196816 RepID=UPI0022AC1C58|nr:MULTISPECIES: hypothetical protein [unclassified Acinetobacter]WAU72982.1 hypothetical protein O1450_12935 [Acinetobacter sp. TR11]WAU76075.1 hypothetical protein O1449_12445 [Acinetobacter sp. TR3]